MSRPDTNIPLLPCSAKDCNKLGWDHVDIVLVTGDAYMDHPSFGVALVGRLLLSHGYRVAILSQPRYDRPDDFRRFGRPRLFFGITAGNLDSIVANYTGNGKVRDFDSYSPGGNPWHDHKKTKNNRRRPDRAVLLYANLARSAYKESLIVLGGIEASLRRFVHYDYKQNKLRDSFLTDAKADLLLYGMAEKSVVKTAKRIGEKKELFGVQGSCLRLTDRQMESHFPGFGKGEDDRLVVLPCRHDIDTDNKQFLTAEKLVDRFARSYSDKTLIQRQKSHWVVQFPAPAPLTTEEMDALYELPFSRQPQATDKDIPAYKMIRHSVTIVRGCSGNCSFCAISRHQGPMTTSRSTDSIVREVQQISLMDDFSGTVSDLGGPTANLWATRCKIGSCPKHDCLYPKVCKNLQVNENAFLHLLREIRAIKGVKHVFISSGLRLELLLQTPQLLKQLIDSHTPGSLKIAPEHTEPEVLQLMHKESHTMLVDFVRTCTNIGKKLNKKVVLNPYIILSHPGSTVKNSAAMVKKLKKLGLRVRQFQDFTPTPGTLSTAMFVTGRHRDTGKKIVIARNQSERRKQRLIIEKGFKGR